MVAGSPSICPVQWLSDGSISARLVIAMAGHGLVARAGSKCIATRVVKPIAMPRDELITSISTGIWPLEIACITAAARSKLPSAS